MPEPIALLTLVTRVKRALALNFPTALWVRGELTQFNERRGNRYLQLSEKGADNSVVARVEGQVWSADFARVLRTRGRIAGEVLALGREVCLQVELEHHEVYGLRLRVVDWDPEFTLGQIELARRDVLARLERDQLLHRNGALALPPVLQRIAVVTSASAAGFADFRHQLIDNPFGYRFVLTHFDVSVQGPDTEGSVVAALSSIGEHSSNFDVVCLIRGGGGRLDLASFDRYGIGAAIADCPIPTFVGIGHETDETVPDFVAHTALKTPTAVAEAILAHNTRYEYELQQIGRRIARHAVVRTQSERQGLTRSSAQLEHAGRSRLSTRSQQLDVDRDRLRLLVTQAFAKTRQSLDARARELTALDPAGVLRRGFTITTDLAGNRIAPVRLSSGDAIRTYFADGQTIDSQIL